jgi:hypothetical protein
VVIGHSGFITLVAMRWIRDVDAAFCQIGFDGNVIAGSSADRCSILSSGELRPLVQLRKLTCSAMSLDSPPIES